ncbi:hypothetical protein MRX96_047815 [Rhipicephalus microplus]|uniref:LYR motif-containing protein 2 n=1 Tax=Rhipicephalus microplus TaxID=6941 RepID=UPI001886F499|nr:LYR motif-containing protein 2-like [Rhipicephalus microplus]
MAASFSTNASNAMTLKRFMLRQEVLKLYRDTLRTIRAVDDERQRRELQIWARHDFDCNKHVTEEDAIKMHIARGKLALKELQSSVHLSK